MLIYAYVLLAIVTFVFIGLAIDFHPKRNHE